MNTEARRREDAWLIPSLTRSCRYCGRLAKVGLTLQRQSSARKTLAARDADDLGTKAIALDEGGWIITSDGAIQPSQQ